MFSLGLKNKGFTIIETMIVLAIGGTILLLIFKTVPSVQRSSRNTKRDNDSAILMQLVENYYNKHEGSFPPTCSQTTSPSCVAGFLQDTKLDFFSVDNVSFFNSYPPASVTPPSNEDVYIYDGYTCGSSTGIYNSTTKKTGAGSDSAIGAFIILLNKESGSSFVLTCRQSN